MSRTGFAPDQGPAASRTEMLASGTYDVDDGQQLIP
jgi:hypothetical protein